MIHWCLTHPWIGLVIMAVIGILLDQYAKSLDRGEPK